MSFYGPGAADYDRTETLGAANAVVEWWFMPDASTHLGVGIGTRAAGVTERYFAFAPAPGGFLIGNPTLDAEKKTEIEWGIDWRHEYNKFWQIVPKEMIGRLEQPLTEAEAAARA